MSRLIGEAYVSLGDPEQGFLTIAQVSLGLTTDEAQALWDELKAKHQQRNPQP